jgi:hypothetical protein
MGIGSWLRKWRKRSDEESIERHEQWATETPEERRVSAEGVVGVQADEFAARSVRETVEEADELAEPEDRR